MYFYLLIPFNSSTIKNMKRIIFVLIAACLVLAACKSTQEIPEDLTAEQLIQLGQDAYGESNYKNAERYYEIVITRYGLNTDKYIEARYELGHLYLKEKKYEKAYDTFKEIEDLYASAGSGSVSPSFNKLAEIGMKQIPANKLPKTEKTQLPAAATSSADNTPAVAPSATTPAAVD